MLLYTIFYMAFRYYANTITGLVGLAVGLVGLVSTYEFISNYYLQINFIIKRHSVCN